MRPPPDVAAQATTNRQDTAPALVPVDPGRFPRPNPGPEPWPSPSRPRLPLGFSLTVLALLVGGLLWFRRRHLRPAALPVTGSESPQADPRHRLIVLSDSARAALATRFGPAWGSKTTEEVAADPGLADLVGEPQAGPLVAFLLAADRAKFADAEPAEDWEPWVASFLAGLAPKAASRRVLKPPPTTRKPSQVI